jgi:hypothetical protein
MRDERYLIIAGTTRAGTTSAFLYLGDHPQICASSVKETRFFLDTDYPLPSKYRLEDGLDKYASYFRHCQEQRWRLEATPDYLYSPGTPRKILNALPEARLVFILRDPIERLVSWYAYAKGRGLPARISFDEYVEIQLAGEAIVGAQPHHMKTLEQGHYASYLATYFDRFERNQILVANYSTLRTDPALLLADVCRFVDIDAAFYKNYEFQVFNASHALRNPGFHHLYVRLRDYLALQVHDRPQLRATLRVIRRRFEPLYFRVMAKGSDHHAMPSETVRALLGEYYRDEETSLAKLLGVEQFTWQQEETSQLA